MLGLEAQALLSLTAGNGRPGEGPVWLDEQQMLFAFGNGVVAQDVEKGTQVRRRLTRTCTTGIYDYWHASQPLKTQCLLSHTLTLAVPCVWGCQC